MQKPDIDKGFFENLKPVKIPFEKGVLETLKAGDLISLTGVLFTGRDQTHRRLIALLDEGRELPRRPWFAAAMAMIRLHAAELPLSDIQAVEAICRELSTPFPRARPLSNVYSLHSHPIDFRCLFWRGRTSASSVEALRLARGAPKAAPPSLIQDHFFRNRLFQTPPYFPENSPAFPRPLRLMG